MTIADDPILLPDPEPRDMRYTIISVDDHVVEPPDMFEGDLPTTLRERGTADRRATSGPRGVGVRRAGYSPRSA